MLSSNAKKSRPTSRLYELSPGCVEVRNGELLDADGGNQVAPLSLLLLALLASWMQVLWPTVRLRRRLVRTTRTALVLDVFVVYIHRFVDFVAEGVVIGRPERCC